MTRVIAGAAGGRRLAVPPGNGTRPTSDRAREGLFSTWESLARAAGRGPGARPVRAAPARSAWRRSPAAPRTSCWSRPTPGPPARSGTTSAALGLPGAEVRAGKAEQIVAGPPPGASRTTWSSSTRPTPSPTTICGRSCSHSVARGWLAEEALVTVERSTRGGEFGWPRRVRGAAGPPLRRGDALVRSRRLDVADIDAEQARHDRTGERGTT